MTIKDHSMQRANNETKAPKQPKDIDAYIVAADEDEKMRLYTLLTGTMELEVKNLNLTEEVGLQFKQAKFFLSTLMTDEDIPANHKAQALNTVTRLLHTMTDMREKIYGQERQKKFDAAWLRTMRELPKHQQETFMELFGEHLNDRGV